MNKLRQRRIFKIPTSFIASSEYDFEMTVQRARKLDYLVALSDNQVFYAIERISQSPFDYTEIDHYYEVVNREKKKPSPNKAVIKHTRDLIDDLLLFPEIINVKVDDKNAYKEIVKNGFLCNGKKYVRLLCGAGMGRRSTVSFCEESIYERLDEVLRNGVKIKEINIAKYNAYYGLYMSGIYKVSTPRFIVVNDCEIPITGNKVDYIVDDQKTLPNGSVVDCRRIEERDFVFEANVFDGAGLISPRMAYQWACDIGANYIPSNFVVRSAFIKGMVCVFDFHTFAEVYGTKDELTGKHKITDLYGNECFIEDADVILTKSQFKMHKQYSSVEEYKEYAKQYEHIWGISKFSPKKDKEYSLLNYQYIMSLDLDDQSIDDLIKYSTDWLYKICSGDELYTKLFAYGVGEEDYTKDDVLNKSDMAFMSALCMNFDLFKDDYIRRKINQICQKKIDDAKIGRLWARGNYQTMIPDPFAMAQHILGLPVVGLLPKDCHYSRFWVDRGVDKIDACRSPMVDASEHKVSSIINNEQIEYWYQYLDSGIVMNIWGLDTIVHSDSDFDGDIVYTTDNEVMINHIYPNRYPITYDKESAPPQKMNTANMIKTDLNTFDCKIGQITNYSTRFFSMLCKYDRESREYKELVDRIKLLRRYIGDSIDAGKGIKTKPFPKEWKSWEYVKTEWDEDTRQEQWFLNNLVEKRKPYFFVYIYKQTMEDYRKAKKELDFECYKLFDCKFSELKSKDELSKEEKDFIKYYYEKLPVTKTPCIMNKIAWKIEDLEFDFKYPKNKESENIELAKTLMNGNYKLQKQVMAQITDVYDYWKKVQRSQKGKKNGMFQNIKDPINDFERYDDYEDEYDGWKEQEYETVKRMLEEIVPNEQHLADYLVKMAYVDGVSASKSFCWKFGGDGIVQTLKEKYRNQPYRIPVEDENGVEYHGKYYRLAEIN